MAVALKISWDEFVAAAMRDLRRQYPRLADPQFKKRNDYEPDMDMYDYPDYVEMELTNERQPQA